MTMFLMPRMVEMDADGATLVAGRYVASPFPFENIYFGFVDWLLIGAITSPEFPPYPEYLIADLYCYQLANWYDPPIFYIILSVSGTPEVADNGWTTMTITGPSGATTVNRADANSDASSGIRYWAWTVSENPFAEGETYQITFE